MDDATVAFQNLGISLLLGLLVGLQRERTSAELGGLRTFPLIAVLGTVSALLAGQFGGWIVAAALLGVVASVVIGNMHLLRTGNSQPGTTTEIAMLLMFAVGAYLVVGHREVAIAVGGGLAVLLQFKPELHGFAARLGDEDLRAIMQFVLISCIVLPILPNRAYGPFEVLNPFEIWLMVVLIVGISLGGYVAYKFLGQRAGTALSGILGGAISSTATTVSYSRRTANAAENASLAALVIVIASLVLYVRVLIEIAAVSPSFLSAAFGPVIAMMVFGVLPLLIVGLFVRREPTAPLEQKNPTELRSAMTFAGLYAVVLLALAAAKEYLGGEGLYLVAGLSGLTDMDAITLSTSRLVEAERLSAANGWRLIIVAAMSNLCFKGLMVGLLGHRKLFAQIVLYFGLSIAGGAVLLALWPDWKLVLPSQ